MAAIEQKPRKTGKKPHNGPASGIPASGIPANGLGWGGPARGAPVPRRVIAKGEKLGPAHSRATLEGLVRSKTAAELALALVPKAMLVLQGVLEDETETKFLRMAAARDIIARAYGNPIQPVTVDTETLSPEDRQAKIRALQAKLAAG